MTSILFALVFISINMHAQVTSGWCGATAPSYPVFPVNDPHSTDVLNDYIGRVIFRLTSFNKYSSCNGDVGEDEYRADVEVLDYNHTGSMTDGISDWADMGTCWGYSTSDVTFSAYPNNYDFYDVSWTNSDVASMFYSFAVGGWEEDFDLDCVWSSLVDECIDGWGTYGFYSIPKPNYYPGYWNYWDVYYSPSNSYSFDILYLYDISQQVGTYSIPLDFGTIDATSCPSAEHLMSNIRRSDPGDFIYYKFTINNHRRLIIDLGYQTGDMTFSLHTVSSGGSISSSAISPYSQSSSLPAAYSTTATYYKKYDLNPGTSPNTYAIKIYTPTEGKFKLKIDSDLNPPNNIYYWTGVAEDPFGTTVTPPENAWNRSNNWDPCIVPNNGITDPNDYTIDVVIPASSEINPNADQPRIYLDYEGKCKSIVINDGAKVTIENSGKLIIKE